MYASADARPSGQMHKIQRDLWCSAPPTPSTRANSRCYIQECLSCLEPASCHPALQVNRALNALQDAQPLISWPKQVNSICLDLTLKKNSKELVEPLEWNTSLWAKINPYVLPLVSTWQLWRTAPSMSHNAEPSVHLGRRSPYMAPEAVLHCPSVFISN